MYPNALRIKDAQGVYYAARQDGLAQLTCGPCCGGPPPTLLKALSCAQCCAGQVGGLAVDSTAVPNYQTMPVFKWAGRCWQIIGDWDSDTPPDDQVVKSVDAQYVNCPACSDGTCQIFRPGCGVIGRSIDSYELTIGVVGSAFESNSGTTWTWNFQSTQEFVADPLACSTGCWSNRRLTWSPASGGGGTSIDPWHGNTFRRGRSWSIGAFTVSSNLGSTTYTANGQKDNFNACFSTFNLIRVGVGVNDPDFATNVRTINAYDSQGNPGSLTIEQISRDGAMFDGYFWLSGNSSNHSCYFVRGTGTATGFTNISWNLKALSYCCSESGARSGDFPLDPAVARTLDLQARGGGCTGCGDR